MEPHPLMRALEERGQSVVELRGYAGTGTAGFLRLYPALDVGSYVEVPRSAVVYAKTSDDEDGIVTLFVAASAEITEVQRRTLPAKASSLITGEKRGASWSTWSKP